MLVDVRRWCLFDYMATAGPNITDFASLAHQKTTTTTEKRKPEILLKNPWNRKNWPFRFAQVHRHRGSWPRLLVVGDR